MDKIVQNIQIPLFEKISEIADNHGIKLWLIGGFVRDVLLCRNSKDIDIVVLGDGVKAAKMLARHLKAENLSVFKNFGTAQMRTGDYEIEIVGARKESYQTDSRKPDVEAGSIEDDQNRRDFTINAMTVSLNRETFGEFTDPFDGVSDLEEKLIRTPLDPDKTFSDDPLRMLRAIRFASQLDFNIDADCFNGIKKNANRIKIISEERIADELNKIMASDNPGKGFVLLKQCSLLKIILPELWQLSGVEVQDNRAHKENFLHSVQVMENIAEKSEDIWLRWAALLHDIGKTATKKYQKGHGWTFHAHDFIGEKMIPNIFKRLKFPLDARLKYVKKMVRLHMRPISLVEDKVTDSAVRRLLFDAGDDIDDLMDLCEADITSKNQRKKEKYLQNFRKVRKKLHEIEEKDRIRNFQPPVDGKEIMETFNISPSPEIGKIKDAIKDAILDGKIPNEHETARDYMFKKAKELGIEKK
ncbi:MAG: HD domain-containing protein [Bacteroidota bacterium]|nr:HD domain-containing protein [Bacteroidota bacterium]